MIIETNNSAEEIWVPLHHLGYNSTHEVSNMGRIRSFVKTRQHKEIPYIINTRMYEDQLLVARVYNKNHSTKVYIANEVIKAFGNYEKNSVIAYIDGDRSNCKLSNIYHIHKDNKVIKNDKNDSIKNEKSCKKCAFYKCFTNQDDGIHFKTDYAKNGCFKYKEDNLK